MTLFRRGILRRERPVVFALSSWNIGGIVLCWRHTSEGGATGTKNMRACDGQEIDEAIL